MRTREAQWPLFHAVIEHIEAQAVAVEETPRDWMVNKRVDVTNTGLVTHADLPS